MCSVFDPASKNLGDVKDEPFSQRVLGGARNVPSSPTLRFSVFRRPKCISDFPGPGLSLLHRRLRRGESLVG